LGYITVKSEIYAIICRFLQFFYIFICSSVECEKAISKIANIITKLRNSFGEESLEDHLIIQSLIGYLNLPEDSITKYKIWASLKSRYFTEKLTKNK